MTCDWLINVGLPRLSSLHCNYAYDHGELSNTQKKAIITLLEKKDKAKRDISNCRPISLINVDVKIGSKAIAKSLESVLPSTIIHFNQCAYVKGRAIFDAVRTTDDILDYTEKSKINGRMIAIDFKKAFDSVSREFLFRTLSAFCFGSSFIQWIHKFHEKKAFQAVVLITVSLPDPLKSNEALDRETRYHLISLLSL